MSKDQATFNRHKTDYEDALRRSGYINPELVYRDPPKAKKRRRRKSAIFFNAPFCLSVKTCIGKEFFKIVDRHFNQSHAYHSIFNRKTVKLSYSCMNNIGSIIRAHNAQVLEDTGLDQSEMVKTCNCTKAKKSECPLQQKCLTKNVIYKAVVTTSSDEKHYVGSTGRTFKERYAGHKYSLRHKASENSTELSKYVWKQRSKGEEPSIRWSILHKLKEPKGPQRICSICNLERMEIAAMKRGKSLNKRSELTGKCVHFRSFYF